MANNLIYYYDGETQTELVREMTDEEQAQRDLEVSTALAAKEFKAQAEAEAEAKRQALLAKLGITEEEARLLLGGN